MSQDDVRRILKKYGELSTSEMYELLDIGKSTLTANIFKMRKFNEINTRVERINGRKTIFYSLNDD